MTIQEDDFILPVVTERPPRPDQVSSGESRDSDPKFFQALHHRSNGATSPSSRLDNHSEALETVAKVSDHPITAISNMNGSAAVKISRRLDNRPEPIDVPPAVDNRYGNRSPAVKARGSEPSRPSSRLTTPRSARRVPDVPRPASRRATDSARRVHNLTSRVSVTLKLTLRKILSGAEMHVAYRICLLIKNLVFLFRPVTSCVR